MTTTEPTKPTEPTAEQQSEEMRTIIRILVGCDRDELREVIATLRDSGQFAAKVSDVFGDAMSRSAATDERFGRVMGPIVQRGVHDTVERDPGKFGEMLAPAMGPAIRQSVRQMFQSLTDSFERTLEQSLSAKSWKWRFESWRTGKPFSEVVFLHTLAYRAEHVFLIHRETGLLLHDVASRGAADADLVSGMLTAIRDFVRDAFEADEEDALRSFQVGDLRVWVEQGPHCVLAIVLRGHAPSSLRQEFRAVLEDIELRHAVTLSEFEGDPAPFEATVPELERCLVEQRRGGNERGSESKPKSKSAGKRLGYALIFGSLLLFLVVWRLVGWRDAKRWEAFISTLRATPGITILEEGRSEGGWMVRGWRDPLAADPSGLVVKAHVDSDRVDHHWEPYHSGHPEFVIERLRQALEPAKGIEFTMIDGVLAVQGVAPPGWRADLERAVQFVPAVTRLDLSGLRAKDPADSGR